MKKIIIPGMFVLIQTVLSAQETQAIKISIDSCIRFALENNKQLKAGQQNISLSKSSIKLSGSKSYPVVKIYGDYGFTNQYTDINLEPIIPSSADEYTVSNLGVEMYQSIWQNKRLNLQTELAKTGSVTAQIQQELEGLNLEYAVKVQYTSMLQQQLLEEFSAEMAQRIEVYVESVKEKYNVGLARKSEILKSETELSGARVIVNRYNTEKRKIEKSILKLMGSDLNQTLELDNFLEDSTFYISDFLIDSLINRGLQNLPEFKLIEQSIKNQTLSINFQKRSNGPELMLYAKYGWQETPMPIVEDKWSGYAGLKLNYTLFDGNGKKHRVSGEKIKLNKCELQKEELKELIATEIHQAVLLMNESKHIIKNSTKQVENARVNLEIVTGEYETGLSSMLELIEAENALLMANRNFVSARTNYYMAKFNLERRTGVTIKQSINF